ncbi:MAG TPA: hypothetical protein VN577_02345 [Terriglobales bacterium]|nr:hypothetical protein [Terriglobales bacterium]
MMLIKIFAYVLEGLFLFGIIGSALVVILAAVDDAKVLLPERKPESDIPRSPQQVKEHFA